MHRRAVPLTLVAAVSITLAGCASGTGTSEKQPSPSGPPAGPGAEAQPPSQGLARDGFYVDSGYSPVRFRTEMQRIERFQGYSVLRFAVTNLESRSVGGMHLFGSWILDNSFGAFSLMDPVGRKLYGPLRKDNDSGEAFGSYSFGVDYMPGTRYEGHVYFPTLPSNVQRMTVRTPGSPGQFSGVPVVTGSTPPPAPTEEPPDESPGPNPTLAAKRPTGKIWQDVTDLYGITEGDARSTASSGTEEKIGLRTDVLFAFDSAELSNKAKAVLDSVAAETRQKADPAKPPITVTGHTDSQGDDPYNLRLSQQRAEAVRRELATRLGIGYQYRASGKGETQPIAKEGGPDDAQARVRNRRVEISYQIKQYVPGTTTSAAPTAQPGAVGPPAQFRLDGKPLAERTATLGAVGYRLQVLPFYRDGAFMVVPFTFTRDKELSVQALVSSDFGATGQGGAFGAFSVIDPRAKVTYRTVRIGPEDNPGYLHGTRGGKAPNLSVRSYIYVAAPPAGLSSVTFDAGPFGKIENVPVQ